MISINTDNAEAIEQWLGDPINVEGLEFDEDKPTKVYYISGSEELDHFVEHKPMEAHLMGLKISFAGYKDAFGLTMLLHGVNFTSYLIKREDIVDYSVERNVPVEVIKHNFFKTMKKGMGGGGILGVLVTAGIGHVGDALSKPKVKTVSGALFSLRHVEEDDIKTLVLACAIDDVLALESFLNRYYVSVLAKKDRKRDKCYVATAVYGDPFAPQVMEFRKYRDEVLIKTVFGRGFVWLYYKLSPRFADWLRAQHAVNARVRSCLDRVYDSLQSRRKGK